MDAGSLESWSTALAAAPSATSDAVPAARGTVTGFIGRTRRGPVNEPVRVQDLAAFTRIFGGASPDTELPRMLAQYFDNGGCSAVVVRVINGGRCATMSVPAGMSWLRLRARDPGRHEWLRVSVDHDQLESDPTRFNLVVQRLGDRQDQRVVDQEIFRRLSIHPGEADYIGDALARSQLVRLLEPAPSERPERTVNAHGVVGYIALGNDGDDGAPLSDYDLTGSATDATGLFALAAVEGLSLVCVPPLAPGRDLGPTALAVAERFCRQRGAMLVFDPPQAWRDGRDALRGLPRMGFSSANAITYFPRLRERRDGGGPVPAAGALAGLLARNDASAGVWRPLDSLTGVVRGGLTVAADLADSEVQALRRHGVNVIVRTGAGQCVLRGDVTFAGHSARVPEWRSLTRRRLALHVLNTISHATRWLLFEQCDPVLWARVRHQVGGFLQQLHEAGAFAGLHPEQSWFVKCDADTVVLDARGQPRLNIVLGIALSRPGEFLIFNIAHRVDGCRISAMPVTRSLSLSA